MEQTPNEQMRMRTYQMATGAMIGTSVVVLETASGLTQLLEQCKTNLENGEYDQLHLGHTKPPILRFDDGEEELAKATYLQHADAAIEVLASLKRAAQVTVAPPGENAPSDEERREAINGLPEKYRTLSKHFAVLEPPIAVPSDGRYGQTPNGPRSLFQALGDAVGAIRVHGNGYLELREKFGGKDPDPPPTKVEKPVAQQPAAPQRDARQERGYV